MHSKKSQAAMEFLMTYGWAIMAVLVAIGALSYFGVLSPDRFVPNRCILPAGIVCMDHEVTDILGPGNGEIYTTLKNSLGYNIDQVSISASGCTSGSTEPLIKNTEMKTFTATGCTIASGKKYSGEINITYTNSDTGLKHTARGTLTARVRSGLV